MDKWDTRFIDIARTVSSWSKDPSKVVGAVVVRDRRIVSTGYNGFPEQIPDDPAKYRDREVRDRYIIHAEHNAIYNASRFGVSTDDTTIYVYGLPPCHSCSLAIVRAGIRRVISVSAYEICERWASNIEMTKDVFSQAGVEYQFYSKPPLYTVKFTETVNDSVQVGSSHFSDFADHTRCGLAINELSIITHNNHDGAASCEACNKTTLL